MSEERWHARPGPAAMLDLIRNRLNERKLRRFGIACCRHVWPLIHDPRTRQSLVTIEAYVEGRIDRQRLEAFWRTSPYSTMITQMPDAGVWAIAQPSGGDLPTAVRVATSTAQLRASAATHFAPPTAKFETFRLTEAAEQHYQCELLGELFGNPYRPIIWQSSWRTRAVQDVADTIHRQQEFELMPILGDALTEAGCGDPAILDHCLINPGSHVRGCWVLDAILTPERIAA